MYTCVCVCVCLFVCLFVCGWVSGCVSLSFVNELRLPILTGGADLNCSFFLPWRVRHSLQFCRIVCLVVLLVFWQEDEVEHCVDGGLLLLRCDCVYYFVVACVIARVCVRACACVSCVRAYVGDGLLLRVLLSLWLFACFLLVIVPDCL